jgi:hypothetical protein
LEFILDLLEYITKTNNIECEWKLCGSHLFGVDDDLSDIDLLCMGKNMSRHNFFEFVQHIAQTCGYFTHSDIIQNKHIFVLRLGSENINVDIQYVDLNNLDDQYYFETLSLIKEPEYIIKLLEKNGKLKIFSKCLMWLRVNFKLKHMYGTIYGYLGGVSLAILVAHIIQKYDVISLDDFKKKLRCVDIDSPISLSNNFNINKSNPNDRFLYIGTSLHPYANTVRTLCKSTKYLIQQQLKFCFSYDEHNFSNITTFNVTTPDDNLLNEFIKWFNGIIVKMLVSIEKVCKGITLFPDNQWEINDLSASWKLYSTNKHTYITHVADDIVTTSKMLFDNVYFYYYDSHNSIKL